MPWKGLSSWSVPVLSTQEKETRPGIVSGLTYQYVTYYPLPINLAPTCLGILPVTRGECSTRMRLLSKVSPVYFQESDKTSVLRPGLNKLAPHEWLVVDEDFVQFYRNKLQCREFHCDKVFQALPGSEAAQRELQNLVIDHLVNDHSNSYQVLSGLINHSPSDLRWPLDNKSLWHTSLWIQEDLFLMELRGDGYYLTAPNVCAPSNWALEKKGRSLDDIHKPFPGHSRELSRRTNRLFASLKPDRPPLRFNWSVRNTARTFLAQGFGAGESG